MGKLLLKLLHILGRHFINFIVIAVILAYGTVLYSEAKENLATQANYEKWRGEFDSFAKAKQDAAVNGAQQAARMSQEKTKTRIRNIDAEIAANNARRPGFTLSPQEFVENQKIEIANSYLAQEKEHLALLLARAEATINRVEAERRLKVLRQVRDSDHKAYLAYLPKYHQCLESWHRCLPVTEHARQVNSSHQHLLDAHKQAEDAYQKRHAIFNSLKIPQPPVFASNDAVAKSQKAKLDGVIDEIRRHWIVKAMDPIKPVYGQALFILLSIILTPIAIKAVFYFVLARSAAKRPPVCLLPELASTPAGKAQTGRISAVSADINFGKEEELFLHPDYVQTSPCSCDKDTKWVLNRKFFFTCLAAGMYGLTRFRSNSPAQVVACPQTDSLAEIGIVDIPEGCAMTFEPHNMIGLVQRRDNPMRISSHWRLFSLTAWLTLQFRFLVFHGPVKLVVQGRRGVKLEQASDGRIINQGATFGYSANLNRSVQRSEVFWPYLRGKEELLNDRFDGHGIYVYAESPFLEKKQGLFGRGIEGVLDSVLKVFGV